MKSDVSIKVNSAIKYEITGTGYLKAQTLLDELIKNEHITKKIDNICLRLDNLLYNGIEIDRAYFDTKTDYVILYLKDKIRY